MNIISPEEILRKYWGHNEFRHIQKDIIESVLNKKDALALIPTGGGKSLCYQVPALMLDGFCLVISPLIALMQDQVMQLKDRNIQADLIYGGQHKRDMERIIDNAINGYLKLLYVSPERLQTAFFQDRLHRMKISFIAVDEAHCISQWGYDFRPSYLKIQEIRNNTSAPVLALTATATSKVQLDICDKLQLKKAAIHKMSFKREHLSLVVKFEEHKLNQIQRIITKTKGTGLIYVRNRKQTVEIAQVLNQQGIVSDFYHAGLDHNVRAKKLADWMQGKTPVMVCTNAFGMGIDKSNVRWVIHGDIPSSIEEYFQEVGRAGRDGLRAYGVLLYNQKDLLRLQSQFENMFPSLEEVQQLYKSLAIYFGIAAGSIMEDSRDFDLLDFCNKNNLVSEKVIHGIKILEQSNWLMTSSAVFQPSRIQIKVEPNEIHEFCKSFPQYSLILTNLMRSYEGIFNFPVAIHENQIAFQIKTNIDHVATWLNDLNREGLISYFPFKEKPQLQFVAERQFNKTIGIDKAWFDFRKKMYKERMDLMISYLHLMQCRQQFLMNYFGEKDALPCGICDRCLEIKNAIIDPQIRTLWTSQIIEILKSNPKRSIRSILELYPSNKESWVLMILQELIGEEKIIRDLDYLYFNKK